MSGKAPPRGPRALLGSLPAPGAGQASTSSATPAPTTAQQHSPTLASPSKRIGATPPTGPRSLAGGIHATPHASSISRGKPKPFVNGHNPTNLGGPSMVGGLGPNTLQIRHTVKGKNSAEGGWTSANGGWQPHSQANGWHDASSGSSTSGSGSGSRVVLVTSTSAKGVRDGLQQARPPIEPPPPPPPTYEPPPPPPPSQPPPPAPPPPPSTDPQPPPPPPPPSTDPQPQPPPPPPSSIPPPPPPPPPQPADPPPPPPPPCASPPPPPPPSTSPPPPPPPNDDRSTYPPSPPPPPSGPPPPPSMSPPPSPPPPSTSPPPPPPSTLPPPPPPSTSPPPPPPPSTLPPLPPPPPPSASPLPPPPVTRQHSTPPQRTPSPKLYSLPPLPSWPGPRTAYPSARPFKVLYDPALDKDTNPLNYFRNLIEHVRTNSPAAVSQERIKGKGKGKEMLIRFEGEVSGKVKGEDRKEAGEEEVVVRDPRRVAGFKKLANLRPGRGEFHEVRYEYDNNSTGLPPPASVLITNISPLTPNQQIRRHFGVYGQIMSFEPQIDKENGSALGIVFIRFGTHEEAKKCVEREDGKKPRVGGLGLTVAKGNAGDGEELRVVFDGEGAKLKAVLKELDDRRRKEREEKKKRDGKGKELNGSGSGSGSALGKAGSTPTPHTPVGQTPNQWRAGPSHAHPQSQPFHPSHARPQPSHLRSQGPQPPLHQLNGRPLHANHPLPPNPNTHANAHSNPNANPNSHFNNSLPLPPHLNGGAIPNLKHALPPIPAPMPARVRRPPPALVRARIMTSKAIPPHNSFHSSSRFPQHGQPQSHSSSSTPVEGPGRGRSMSHHYKTPHYQHSPMDMSRSPSPPPILRAGMGGKLVPGSKQNLEKEREVVVSELARNGMDHVKIDGGAQLSGAVREEDVREFFTGFKVDKVLKDYHGWYVTFETGDAARRAAMVLNSRTLAYHTVTVSVHPPPAPLPAPSKIRWEDDELIDQAQQIIIKELRGLLEKDVMERVVGTDLRKLVAGERTKGDARGREKEDAVLEQKPAEKKGLKGLSFKKQNKRVREEEVRVEEVKAIVAEVAEVEEEEKEVEEEAVPHEEVMAEPPKKRRKKEVRKVRKVVEEDIESEDEDTFQHPFPLAEVETVQKRAIFEDREDDEPAKKRQKTEVEAEPKAKKTSKKKPARKGTAADELVDEIILPDDLGFDIPDVAQVRFTPGFESSLSPSRSPSPVPEPKHPPRLSTPPPSPPLDPLKLGLCKDDEDLYFARLSLSGEPPSIPEPAPPTPPPSTADAPPPLRRHTTGSARTEGYYKITHAEKAAYVTQYKSRTTNTESTIQVDEPQPQHVTSSRSNRANARRRALGLEEINQVQRAVALSKGETTANELSFKFNQLQTRKKHLRFARSPIHDWGLYAMEKISRGEMVIEYVGEVIRAQVADKREKVYERQGIGSSYLFRIDEDLVVDATKKGNLGRLINHSCDPNCTAKIITINSEKKIVIYAKQDIELGDEITYDYHFPIEQDKIPCLCGSAKCRGYLN